MDWVVEEFEKKIREEEVQQVEKRKGKTKGDGSRIKSRGKRVQEK